LTPTGLGELASRKLTEGKDPGFLLESIPTLGKARASRWRGYGEVGVDWMRLEFWMGPIHPVVFGGLF